MSTHLFSNATTRKIGLQRKLDEGEQLDWSNLRLLRRLCRLSQPEVSIVLARYVGTTIDYTTISSHENNRRNPDLQQLEAYSRLYKVPIHCLCANLCTRQELLDYLTSDNLWEFERELFELEPVKG